MGKQVLVTGASRGIGKAIAFEFQAAGYDVIALSSALLDLSLPAAVQEYIEALNTKPDIIINNAGVNPLNLVENIKDKDIEDTMNIMYYSPLILIRASVPHMKANNFGRIVNIGSIWSVVSKPGRLVYSSAKHALDGITDTLAVELAQDNILINTVCPGFTDTEMTSQNNTPQQISALCEEIPIGRMAKPEEIARLVYFLGSEQNTYITGQKIAIDGGYSTK